MRVLHLIDPASPGCGPSTLRRLGDLARREPAHRVVIVGGDREVEIARSCGIVEIAKLHPPRRLALAARGALQRVLASGEKPEIIHAWSLPTALLAGASVPRVRRVVSFPIVPSNGLGVSLLRALSQRYPSSIVVESRSAADEVASLGLALAAHVAIAPLGVPVSIGEDDAGRDWRERHAFGEDDFVMGVLGEPASWVDCRPIAKMISRLLCSGRRVIAVVPQGAAHRGESAMALERMGLLDVLISDEQMIEPWRVARGLNVAIWPGGELGVRDSRRRGTPWALAMPQRMRHRAGQGIGVVLAMMATGTPVLAESTHAMRDSLSGAPAGVMMDGLIEAGDENAFCRQLARMLDDPSLAKRMGAVQKSWVQDRFEAKAERLWWEALYRTILKRDEHSAGAGLDVGEVVVLPHAGQRVLGDA